MSSTPLERAEQAVTRARDALLRELRDPTEWIGGEVGASDRESAQLADALVAAVERCCAERVQANGWFVAASVIAAADACQFHAPAGDPCAADGCGHAAGDDCHPRSA